MMAEILEIERQLMEAARAVARFKEESVSIRNSQSVNLMQLKYAAKMIVSICKELEKER